MKLTYHEGEDGLMYPDLTIRGADTQRTLGKYGLMRRNFLRDKKPAVFQSMLIRVTLWEHLWETEDKADEMEERLMQQMAEQEGVTEQLKAVDQLGWVARMNSIKHRVEETILGELIYA